MTGKTATAVLAWLAMAVSLTGAARDCDGSLSSRGLKIREIKVESRLNTVANVPVALRPGDVLTRESLSNALTQIRDDVKREIYGVDDGQLFADVANRGSIQVFFTKACLLAAPDGGVDVIIQPWTVKMDLPAKLPQPVDVPRSPFPVNRSAVTPGLRALNPTFGMSYDRALDATLRGGFATSLGELSRSLSREPDKPRNSDVFVAGSAGRSMKSDNYATRLVTGYEYRSTKSSYSRFAVTSNLSASRQPIGADSWLDNAVRTGISYQVGARGSFWRGAGLSVAHRFSGNRTSMISTNEQAAEFRGVLDYRLPGGIGRTLILADNGHPEKAASYTRAGVRSGYAAEIPVIPLRNPDTGDKLISAHTLGVEVQFTAGKSWGTLPQYATFFGGNDDGHYVFDDSLDSQFVRRVAMGPVLRGYGSGQAQAERLLLSQRGATSYWGINTNLAFPIPKWSKFLIPPDPDEDGFTIPQRIEGAGLGSSKNLLAAYYQQEENLTPEQAEAKAEADINTVRPAVRYIARYAKLYGVRPIAMFDAAQLRGGVNSHLFYSAGAGIQLTLVVARFELGYAWALNRQPGDPPGNVIFRLSFQNLF